MSRNQKLLAITARLRERSKPSRDIYLERIAQAAAKGVSRASLSCGNLAHGFAACAAPEKAALRSDHIPNLGIVTAYNDMLSAHQPYETFPAIIREAAREAGGVAQVAGGVPAMCDGITQGQPG
ncbi:MAG: phosphogluconate dehydratase, partial [Rhizobiaceae bacterium]